MDEPGSAFFFAIISVALAGAVAFGLYRLITVKGKPLTAIDYGRKWTAGMVAIASMTTLPKFFRHLDIDSFLKWVAVTISFGILAFIAGLIYGKISGPKKEELPKMKDNQTGTDKIPSISIPCVSENNALSKSTQGQVKANPKPIDVNAESTILTPAMQPIPKTELNQEDFYAQAWDEINDQSKTPNKAMWSKAFSMTQGDEKKTQAKYIELRVTQLQEEQARLQQIKAEQEEARLAEEKAKAEADKRTPEKMYNAELQALAKKAQSSGYFAVATELIERLGGKCKDYGGTLLTPGVVAELWGETHTFSTWQSFVSWVINDVVPRVLDECQKMEKNAT